MNKPNRKQTRLKHHDYSKAGYYFVTMCTKDQKHMFWQKDVGAPIGRQQGCLPLSNIGIKVDTAINNISKIYANVLIDKYVIMPNHVHIIIILNKVEGRAMRAPTLSNIINQFKGYVTKQVGYPIWQKLFHDHIIRNQKDYQRIWQYINTNPQKWELDKYYREC